MSLDENNKKERIRTVTWDDPRITARDVTSISGLDYIKSIKDGKIRPPPIDILIGCKISQIDKGHAVFELEPGEYLYNPFATVHGGIASALLDTTMTATILSTLPIGFSCSTVEIKVNFIRPITSKTGMLRCEAKPVHVGNRIATVEGKLKNRQNRLFAHALGTCIIFKVKDH